MTPKQLAAMMDKAGDIHEASFNNARVNPRYTKTWEQCCREAGMPEEWIGLVAPYMSLGYVDTWEWTAERSKDDA